MINKIIIVMVLLANFLNAKVLTPDEAFTLNSHKSNDALVFEFKLGEDIYLYEDKIKFDLVSPENVNVKEFLNLPKTIKYKEFQIYREKVEFYIPLKLLNDLSKNQAFSIKVSWQGCSDQGLCYQPMNKTFSFLANGEIQEQEKLEQNKTQSEQDSIALMMKNSNIALVLVSFFGFGLLLSLTPCIFPMIPILSSIIVSKSGESMSAKKGFLLSLVYVIGMALAYAIAGVLAGIFGANLQTAMQIPWVIYSFSVIFILLSLSMFGFYELKMPSFLQNSANKGANSQSGFVGVFIMGFLSALVVSPCVAPPLAGALLYISQSADATLGGLALFFMGLGTGVPLLFIGIFGAKVLPKPGIWMDSIKALFGVVLLGVAIWLIGRVVSGVVYMSLWSVLLLGVAFYLKDLALFKSKFGSNLVQILALLLGIYGILVFVGGNLGANDPLKPFANLSQKQVKTNESSTKITNLKDLQELINTSSKPVLIDFTASWCAICQELEHKTFSDFKVQEALNEFEFVQIDVSENTADDKQMLAHFSVFGPPAMIFYNNKKELKNLQLVGFISASDFIEHLKKVKG